MNFETIISTMQSKPLTSIFMLAILADILFGVLRAFKQRVFNSSFGIDGAIRKIGMILCVIALYVVDYLLKFDLIALVPETVKSTIGIEHIGLSSFFAILFTLYESVSILKNLKLCGVALPEFINKFLEKTIESIEHIGADNKSE